MRGNTKLFALVASALMVVSVLGTGAVGAVAAAGNSTDGELSVGVTQSEGVTVSVTSNGTAVEGAAVSVTADGNYSGAGDYTTGADGAVTLSAPEENVTVTVTAAYNNTTASTTADLVATTADETGLNVGVTQSGVVSVTANGTGVGNASVSVATDGNYSGVGDYTTGADGTVTLPAPEENVTVSVTASYENMTASTTADLVVGNATNETAEFVYDGEGAFGEDVAAFVKYAKSHTGDSKNLGQMVSQFVTTNNPGKSKHKATHPVFGEDDGNETDTNETETEDDDKRRGPPADKGPDKDKKDKKDKSKGKPAHAGGDDADDAESEDEDDEEDDSEKGNGNGNGNGRNK